MEECTLIFMHYICRVNIIVVRKLHFMLFQLRSISFSRFKVVSTFRVIIIITNELVAIHCQILNGYNEKCRIIVPFKVSLKIYFDRVKTFFRLFFKYNAAIYFALDMHTPTNTYKYMVIKHYKCVYVCKCSGYLLSVSFKCII